MALIPPIQYSGFNYGKFDPSLQYIYDSSIGDGGAYRAVTPADLSAGGGGGGSSANTTVGISGGQQVGVTGTVNVNVVNANLQIDDIIGVTQSGAFETKVSGVVGLTGSPPVTIYLSGLSNTLVTGSATGALSFAYTGNTFLTNTVLQNTIFYRFSGIGASGRVTFNVEARDRVGDWGYILDTVSLSGAGLVTSIATYNTPLNNGIRAAISTITSGSGYCYVDSSY